MYYLCFISLPSLIITGRRIISNIVRVSCFRCHSLLHACFYVWSTGVPPVRAARPSYSTRLRPAQLVSTALIGCRSQPSRASVALDASWALGSSLNSQRNPRWLQLYLAACKLLDLALVLPPEALPQFQLWVATMTCRRRADDVQTTCTRRADDVQTTCRRRADDV